MTCITDDAIVQTFDQLVSDGVIMYGPHEAVQYTDEEYTMVFRICPALSTKPPTIGAALSPAFDKSRRWGPGSDMYCPDERLILDKLHGTHDLALNMFCVDRPQFLVLTLDSFKRQYEPLDGQDLAAALAVLRRFPSHYVIFNCSEAGGCSRVHKHLQGLRGPPQAFEMLVGGPADKVPFRYFAQHLEQGFKDIPADVLLSVYNTLLSSCRSVLGVGESDVCPHNVILWKDYIILIPRRKGTFQGASANAGGMMGSVWITKQEDIDKWLRIGCANVLRELGVPVRKNN